MKKVVMIMVLSISLGVLTGCNNKSTDTSDLKKQIAQMQSENAELKSHIEESSKPSADTEVESTKEPESSHDEEKTDDKFSGIDMQVTNKVNHEKDIYNGRYSPFIELVYQVSNNTDKVIQGIQGVLHINDMFDKNIINLNFDLTSESIPSMQSITVNDYGLEVNEFMDDHMKLYNTDYSKLIFKYEYKSVIFSDGTKIEAD